jgi:hypothetical protein
MASQAPSSVVRKTIWFFAAVSVGAFFSHTDLAHTVFSSYAILQGHFLDFYSVNSTIMVGNEYPILLYCVFALWMAPLFFLNISTPTEEFAQMDLGLAELVWAKIGLVGLLLFIGYLTAAIVRDHFNHWTKDSDSTVVWRVLLSPFALFAVVAMGQYDVIGLTLAMLGFRAWLDGKARSFLVFFALAVSFKYFAILIFLPLVLIGAKSIRAVVLQCLAVASPLAIQYFLYFEDAGFRDGVIGRFLRFFSSDGPGILSLLLVAIVGMGLITYVLKSNSVYTTVPERNTKVLFAILWVLTLSFLAISWNPQWLLYLVPFWAILQGHVRWGSTLLLVETIGFAGLVWMTVHVWSNNLDETMALRSPLTGEYATRYVKMSEFLLPELLAVGILLLYLSFAIPLFVTLIGKRRFVKPGAERTLARSSKVPLFLKGLSFGLLFLIPNLISLALPKSLAMEFSPNSNTNFLIRSEGAFIHSEVLLVEPGEEIVAEVPNPPIEAIGVSLDVWTQSERTSLSVSGLLGARPGGSADFFLSPTAVRDSSFPGFRGWATVDALLVNPTQEDTKSTTVRLRNTGSTAVGFWVDQDTPSSSLISLPTGEVVPGDLLFSWLVDPR